jgi:hypothetical protein
MEDDIKPGCFQKQPTQLSHGGTVEGPSANPSVNGGAVSIYTEGMASKGRSPAF